MRTRIFDHIDLRVRDMTAADALYQVLLPALGFPSRGVTSHCVYYEMVRDHPKPEFIALIEDRAHIPNSTRIAFWCDTKEEVDALGVLIAKSAAQNLEGPMFCPEYSPTYYAVFFDDPCGNRLEICCRYAKWPDASPCAAANPAIASRLQSHALAGRVAELGSLARSHQQTQAVPRYWKHHL